MKKFWWTGQRPRAALPASPARLSSRLPSLRRWISTPTGWKTAKPAAPKSHADYTQRMLEVLRKSPVLRLPENKTVTFKNVRQPARTLSLAAEAMVDATAPGQSPTLQDAIQEATEKDGKALPLSGKPVAFVFGPENGAVKREADF